MATMRPSPGRVPDFFGLIAVVIFAIASASATVVAAQGAPEEEIDPFAGVEEMVVISAEYTAGLLQTGSDSVTAFDSAKLDALGIVDVSDLSDFTPNLNVVTAGTTSPTLFIRGVGLNDFSVTSSGAIAVYQDDVALNSSAIQLGRIFDVESVAVLRGPQGSGPYRNASGGAIKIFPRKPSGNLGGEVNFSYGNYDYVDVEGALEAPIIEDVLAVRVAFGFTDRGGYQKNRCGNAPPFDERTPRTGGGEVDPRWSICGDAVENFKVSEIPVGLPTRVNRENNWAMRGMFRFTPDLSIETIWNLNIHGAQVDDDSALGQAIGTEGLATRTPNEPGGSILTEGLGGFDPDRYRDVDVQERADELFDQLIAQCGDLCQPPTPAPIRREARATVNFERNRILSNELSDLDSDPWAGAYNRVGPTTNDTYGGSLKGDISLTDTMTLTTITGYENWDRLVDVDLDFTPNTAFQLITDDEGYQVTQEIRINDEIDTALPISWEIGGLLFYEDLRVEVQNDFGNLTVLNVGERRYDQQTLSGVLYFEGGVDISESWRFEAGARYNVERKELDYLLQRTGLTKTAQEDEVWDSPTGTIRLNYLPTEDATFYAKYTRGWKSGNFNATGNLIRGVTLANPEEVTAYEVGLNISLFEARLQFVGALFFYDYDNYQIFTSDNNLGSNPEFVTINANSAENYGAELEVDIAPWEGADVEVSFGWLESQFLDFTQEQLQQGAIGNQGFLSVTELNYSGNRLLNSPEFTVSIIASQEIDLDRFGILTLRYSGAWTDNVYFDASEGRGIPNDDEISILPPDTIGQTAYWLHGAGVDWRPQLGHLRLSGWIRNIADKSYKTFSFDANTFQGTTIHFVGEPRTYGVTFGVEF